MNSINRHQICDKLFVAVKRSFSANAPASSEINLDQPIPINTAVRLHLTSACLNANFIFTNVVPERRFIFRVAC